MASKQLLSNFGKRGDSSFTTNGIAQGLSQIKVDIEDTAHFSKYFKVVEFDPVFTAGKNSISFNGSDFLADGSEIKVEVLDADGNSLFLAAPARLTNYVDIANFTVAIYVYKETVAGAGKVILVGTTAKGEIVRWTGAITINTTYQNVSRVRFYNAPYMEVNPLLYPVIQNTTGSTLTTDVSVSGSFWWRIDNPQGNSQGFVSSQGNVNTPLSLPPDAAIVLWAYSGSSNNRVDAFNSQMEGQSIILHYDYADTQIQSSPTAWQYKHADVETTITKVLSTSEIEVVGIPLGPVAQLSASGGQFTSSYTRVTYIQQATTIPCTATWVPLPSPGYMEVQVNTNVFTASMVGQPVTMKYSLLTVVDLHSGETRTFDPSIRTTVNYNPVTGSEFVIRSITGSRIMVTDPFTYVLRYGSFSSPGSYFINSFTASKVTGSITLLSASSPYQQYVSSLGSASLMKKSYANIVYRDIETFSGFVARHKLYARSNIYPGNFELIDDTVIGPSDLLVDPITTNKNFSTIGVFTNQDHINQYWFVSSASLYLEHSNKPRLDSMVIRPTPDYTAADGNSYVIAKATSIGVINDQYYYPYDEAQFNQFSGVGYNSNFIFVQKDVLFALETKMIVNKYRDTTATVMFFLTSSIPSIKFEKNYIPAYGLKLGEVVVKDKVTSRIFNDPQQLFFTPLEDYYGTLVIVPVNCEVILSNLSLKNYGDHGYSPGASVVQIPFPINIANEKWTLKSELFDSNYNLIYTLTPVVQAFDPSGASLFGTSTLGTTGGGGSSTPTTLPTLTITGQLYLPNLAACSTTRRLMGYNIPPHYPPLSGEGSVCYTNVSDLSLIPTNTSVTTKDYINVVTEEGTGTHTGRSIAVRYSGSSPSVFGRRVAVTPAGVKTTYL